MSNPPFILSGVAAARGIAIGQATLVTAGQVDVAHYFIEPHQAQAEITRLRNAAARALAELAALRSNMPAAAPTEIAALLDVHIMLLRDEAVAESVTQWITEKRYNAQWALAAQLEVMTEQFRQMKDPYFAERAADLEQVVERVMRAFAPENEPRQAFIAGDGAPRILVARDIGAADLLKFKESAFEGFVTEKGGATSHTAIAARSLGIPAVVGARAASRLVQQDDWLIVDGDSGQVVVVPTPEMLEEYRARRVIAERRRERLERLRNVPSLTRDRLRVELLANIELPQDATAALHAGAVGVGLFRSEFLFLNRTHLPDEEEQFEAYRRAVQEMRGLPVTIRTVDVGADKPLRNRRGQSEIGAQTNPALGRRAIRWSLSEPDMFLAQLRAILRASAFGPVRMMIPMLTSTQEAEESARYLEQARAQLLREGQRFSHVPVGALIEVPAAALTLPGYFPHFDFFSIGVNDLTQYTLALDRADEEVAHLYDAAHPAVLMLVARIIAECQAARKSVTLCGEMAGDTFFTRFLLGVGLRQFSMQPTQLLDVKEAVLQSDVSGLTQAARAVLSAAKPREAIAQLNQMSF